MFILHVKHYYFQEILKISLLVKNMHFYWLQARLPMANYKIFEVPGFGFCQGLRQRSVSREALGPRMVLSLVKIMFQ
jgi:hypothetical protein